MKMTRAEKSVIAQFEEQLIKKAKRDAMLAFHVHRLTRGQRAVPVAWGGYPSRQAAVSMQRVYRELFPEREPLKVERQRSKEFPFMVIH